MKAKIICSALALVFLLPLSVFGEEMKIPDLDDSHLSIPWKDFKEILKLIQPKEKPPPEEKPPPPPVDYSLTSAHYRGRMEKDAAAFDAAIKLTVLASEKWVTVPVLPASLALENLEIDGRPALVRTDGGWHRIMLLGPGEHTITCRFFVPTGNRQGPRSVTVSLPSTPLTTLSFLVPEPEMEIKADPANVNRMTYADDSSLLSSVLPSTSRVTIGWARRVEVEEAELRLNAEVESLVSLGERLCRVESVIRYEILHRGVTGFKLHLPKDASVVDVRGTGLADWKTRKMGDRQTLTVSLNYEAKGSYNLTLSYETALLDATARVAVPELEPADVAREVGHIGVAARTNIEVDLVGLENLATLDVSQLPTGIAVRSQAPLIHAFKYIGHPWSLDLQTTKHEDVEMLTCAADKLVLHGFMTKDGELLTRAVWAMRNNREQFMRVELPEGAEVLSAFRGEDPIRPARDGKLLLLPLEKAAGVSGTALSFTIEVTYLVELGKMEKKGDAIIQAPKTDVMTNAMEWRLYVPKDYRYKLDKDATTMEAIQIHLPPPPTHIAFYGDYNTYADYYKDLKEDWPDTILMLDNAGDMSSTDGDDNINGWIKDINKDRDEFNEKNVIAPEQVLSNVMVYLDSSGDKDAPVTATLPVRFEVPESGIRFDFSKSLIKKHEPNTIALEYKKRSKVAIQLRRFSWHIVAVVVLVTILIVIRRKLSKRKLAGKGGADSTGQGGRDREVKP